MIFYYMVVTLHFIVCIALIAIVLLQAGKGGGMAGIFGGGGSDQIFSAPSGMAFIKKVTVVCAVVFMLTSLTLTMLSSKISMASVINQIQNIPAAAPQQPK